MYSLIKTIMLSSRRTLVLQQFYSAKAA